MQAAPVSGAAFFVFERLTSCTAHGPKQQLSDLKATVNQRLKNNKYHFLRFFNRRLYVWSLKAL